MGKLNLVVVDRDGEYVHSLLDYLMTEHAHQFLVSSYTEEKELASFLTEEEKTANCDLIVTSGDYYQQIKAKVKCMVILLDDGKSKIKEKVERAINKYQYGERIVADILKLYTEEIATQEEVLSDCDFFDNKGKAKIIGIYSPIGGVGKTTIAVGACIQSAWEGQTVFYLNLENTPTTPLYFRGEQEKNLANVLYYLKGNKNKLALQIESSKCVDPLYRVHYFKPPDSIIDFNEDVTIELRSLLQILKTSQQYERIFVDLSSEINKNNLAVLKACDALILVAQDNMTSVIKLKGLYKEIRILFSPEKSEELLKKCNLVLNKEFGVASGDVIAQNMPEVINNEKRVIARIPMVKHLVTLQEGLYKIDLNSGFGKAIHQLLLNF